MQPNTAKPSNESGEHSTRPSAVRGRNSEPVAVGSVAAHHGASPFGRQPADGQGERGLRRVFGRSARKWHGLFRAFDTAGEIGRPVVR